MRLSGVRSAVKAQWRSSVALGFALLHAIVFLVIIFSEPALPPPSDEPCPPLPPGSACFDMWDAGDGIIVASRFFHQDLEFDLLMTVDLPGLLVETFVTLPLTLAHVRFSKLTESYIIALTWLLFGTMQWWFIGVIVASTRVLKRQGTAVVATLIGSGVIVGALYRTVMSAPSMPLSLTQFEWAGLVLAAALGVLGGIVSRQRLAVVGGASVGLLGAAAELETHTDVIVGPWWAINLALENQSHLMFPILVALGTGAVAGDWIRGRAATMTAKSS